jgi:hypothetical protein
VEQVRFVILAGLLVTPAATPGTRQDDATRHWVLERLHASLSSPLELGEIASMLFGLVNVRDVAEQPDTRRVLGELSDRVRLLDPTTLGCDEVINLHVIEGFLDRAGMALDPAALTTRVQDCLDEVNPFDKASALFALCYFDGPVSRQRLTRAMEAIEALQLPDGSFGSGYGMEHFYTTTHAVFALHVCGGDPLAIQLGQDFLINSLPRLRQAGFIDALMQSLLMLKKMGVEIPEERRYVAYLRSRIRTDGSICCFDHPGCPSDRHATSMLLEFLRVFPAATIPSSTVRW